MNIVRGRLKAADVIPPGRRYNPECDCIETSPDGGTTWVEDPSADPRVNPANLLPPRTTGDPRCDAAEAMMQHFKAQVDAFLAGSSAWTIVSVFIPLLFFIPGVNAFVALLFEIVSGLFAIGTVVVDAAMTEAVYDEMKCIFYANIGEDGQMSAEQLTDVQSAIDAEIGGTPNLVFDLFAGLWTEIVFSNAGAVGEYEGDCVACGISCHEWDFTVDDGGWFAQTDGSGDLAVYEATRGWHFAFRVDTCNHWYCYIQLTLDENIDNITGFEMEFEGDPPIFEAAQFQQGNGLSGQTGFLVNDGTRTQAGTITAFDATTFVVALNDCDYDQHLAKLRVYWTTGANYLAENC